MGGRDQFDTNIIIKQHKAVVTRENICHAENVIFPGIMLIVFTFKHCDLRWGYTEIYPCYLIVQAVEQTAAACGSLKETTNIIWIFDERFTIELLERKGWRRFDLLYENGAT